MKNKKKTLLIDFLKQIAILTFVMGIFVMFASWGEGYSTLYLGIFGWILGFTYVFYLTFKDTIRKAFETATVLVAFAFSNFLYIGARDQDIREQQAAREIRSTSTKKEIEETAGRFNVDPGKVKDIRAQMD